MSGDYDLNVGEYNFPGLAPTGPIAILDRSAFRRACIAATMAPFASAGLESSATISSLPDDFTPSVIIVSLDAGDAAQDEIEAIWATLDIKNPDCKLVILTDDPLTLLERFLGESGRAHVVLPDNVHVELLVGALRFAELGFGIFPCEAVQPYRRAHEDGGSQFEIAWDESSELPTLKDCTPRQREVISRLLLGLSNREIAAQLDITESTVKAHLRIIMEMLDVSNRTQIVSKLIFPKKGPLSARGTIS